MDKCKTCGQDVVDKDDDATVSQKSVHGDNIYVCDGATYEPPMGCWNMRGHLWEEQSRVCLGNGSIMAPRFTTILLRCAHCGWLSTVRVSGDHTAIEESLHDKFERDHPQMLELAKEHLVETEAMAGKYNVLADAVREYLLIIENEPAPKYRRDSSEVTIKWQTWSEEDIKQHQIVATIIDAHDKDSDDD